MCATPAVVKVAVDRRVQTVGRRKEAVVRVRLTPGTGVFTFNGRTMDNYFPNKVPAAHQGASVQLEKDGIYDVIQAERRRCCRARPALFASASPVR